MMKDKKKLVAKKRQGRKPAPKRQSRPYTLPKTAAELGIVCSCGKPVVWFDYEIGERNHISGFVCDEHKISNRVEKLAQPTGASVV
jgi:hypothetical protein